MTFAADGPYFEDLEPGTCFDDAPAVTLTEGHAAVHQSIIGDRLRLPLDSVLSARVTGRTRLAHPALVWNLAIGQSTLATRRVKANLFYRSLAFHRAPAIGDTLHTTTTVVALRQNAPKPGRSATGLAVLRIVTADQQEQPILDFHRCAMIPLRDPNIETGHHDDLSAIGAETDIASATASLADWNLTAFPKGGLTADDLRPGRTWDIPAGDVVSSAPELARLTLNIAAVHHDSSAAGVRRLVYGGHTIALALAQISRDLPGLITVPAWHGCDHLAPVYEGDTLRTRITIENRTPIREHATLLDLRAMVTADRDGTAQPVLDWRFLALHR
ncbi:MaoC family dehydratase [Nocardia crassostreae]|uniref:MaoC family dehydratase n=1 Tax=Nocardia crassostreae TaxID=53428 RepID=UPI00082A8A57|nr:MaoC family dehydratase [Nocardia crassostreae]